MANEFIVGNKVKLNIDADWSIVGNITHISESKENPGSYFLFILADNGVTHVANDWRCELAA